METVNIRRQIRRGFDGRSAGRGSAGAPRPSTAGLAVTREVPLAAHAHTGRNLFKLAQKPCQAFRRTTPGRTSGFRTYGLSRRAPKAG